MRRKLAMAGAALIVVAGGLTGVALARGGDSEVAIGPEELGPATRAALAETGGGRVTETEVGDEEGYYEVEVTLEDGSQVDVHLDRDFNVLLSEADNEEADEADDDDRT